MTIHVLIGIKLDGVGFHCTTENDSQLNIFELFIS